jgi:hypothetical protein
MSKLKPFAKKLALEGTYFNDLSDLVEESIYFARCAGAKGCLDQPRDEVTAELAASFCKIQDKKQVKFLKRRTVSGANRTAWQAR